LGEIRANGASERRRARESQCESAYLRRTCTKTPYPRCTASSAASHGRDRMQVRLDERRTLAEDCGSRPVAHSVIERNASALQGLAALVWHWISSQFRPDGLKCERAPMRRADYRPSRIQR